MRILFHEEYINTNNLFFSDYASMESEIGGYAEQFKPLIYDRWCREWTPERHAEILESLRQFVRSGDFRMRKSVRNQPVVAGIKGGES